MKNIITLSLLLMLLAGCTTTTKPTQSINHNSSCQEIQEEIERLKKEKKNDLVNTTEMVIMGVYGYGNKDKKIDEKIKVLKMRLLECK